MTDPVQALFAGALVGFVMALPVGPVAALCISSTLARGRAQGLKAGFGSALGDAAFAGFALMGLRTLGDDLTDYGLWLRLLGGAVLLIIGTKALLTRQSVGEPGSAQGGVAIAVSAFLLTLTNPLTLVAFAAAFASLGILGEGLGMVSLGVSLLGVSLGAFGWWSILTWIAKSMGQSLSNRHLTLLHRGMGAVLLIFGLVLGVTALGGTDPGISIASAEPAAE